MTMLAKSSQYPGDKDIAPLQVILSMNTGSHLPYVVHTKNLQTNGCYGGFYTKCLKEAVIEFEERCKRKGVKPYVRE